MELAKFSIKNTDIWNSAFQTLTLGDGRVISVYDCSSFYPYAARWAAMMEAEIAAGYSAEECAEETSYRANEENVSEFAYRCAVETLIYCWEHGNELGLWYEQQLEKRRLRFMEEDGSPCVI